MASIEVRIASARDALSLATSEHARADALVEEASAALERELIRERAALVHPAIRAARVRLGELSTRDVIESLRLLPETELQSAIRELVPVTSSAAWLELCAAHEAARASTGSWLDRAQTRGDFSGCLEVFSRGAACTAQFIADVFERHGADAAALFAAHARFALAASPSEERSIGDEAALLLALPADEARPRVLGLSSAIEPEGRLEFDEDYGERDPRSLVLLALISAGEIQRAFALFDRVLRAPLPWVAPGSSPLVTPGLRRSLVALSGAITAEERLALHRSVHDRFSSEPIEPSALVALCELLDEPFASRCAEALIAVINEDPARTLWISAKHPLVRARCIERSRSVIVERLSRAPLESADRYALSTALSTLPVDDALVPWVIERFAAIDRAVSEDRIARFGPLQWVLDAAKQRSMPAQRALIERLDQGERLWESPGFCDAMPEAVLRAAVRRGLGASVSRSRLVEWVRRFAWFLAGADEGERERWWPSLRALDERSGDATALLECAKVVPASEARAWADERALTRLRTMHDAEALARSLARHGLAGAVIERAMLRFGPEHPYARVDWLNALIVRFVSEERAAQWLAECYAPDPASPAALSPLQARRFIESQDVFASDAWLRRAPSKGLVDALSRLDDGAALLERCAAACWALWLADGARPETPAWFSLRDFIDFASLETACAMAAHPWNAESSWAAHRVCLRLGALRRRTPESVGAIIAAARTLAAGASAGDGSPWARACLAWVCEEGERSFDAVFRPVIGAALAQSRADYAGDALALGVSDAVFALAEGLGANAALSFIEPMLEAVSEAAFERALPWVEAAFASDPERGFAILGPRVASLSTGVLAARWVTATSERAAAAVFARPHALRALAGDEGFERIGDALARAVDELSRMHRAG